MDLLNKPLLEECKKKHARLASGINRFISIVEASKWKSPIDIKDTFGHHADVVGRYWVINIGGSKGARAILIIRFEKATVLVDKIFTDHDLYMKWSKEVEKRK